jgi:hypothetical protein
VTSIVLYHSANTATAVKDMSRIGRMCWQIRPLVWDTVSQFAGGTGRNHDKPLLEYKVRRSRLETGTSPIRITNDMQIEPQSRWDFANVARRATRLQNQVCEYVKWAVEPAQDRVNWAGAGELLKWRRWRFATHYSIRYIRSLIFVTHRRQICR